MKDYNIGFCRQCINKKYKLKLKSEDCIYEMYMGTCFNCKCSRNIVSGLHFFSKIAVLLGLKRASKKQMLLYSESEAIHLSTPQNSDYITTTEYTAGTSEKNK